MLSPRPSEGTDSTPNSRPQSPAPQVFGHPLRQLPTRTSSPHSHSHPSSPLTPTTPATFLPSLNDEKSHLKAIATGTQEKHEGDQAVGLLDESVYSKLLPGWRMKLRGRLIASLEKEMPILVNIQQSCRTPSLDVYFVKTSLLGSHTFFMLFIPIWFWFGKGDVGRGLLYVLAAGGYSTSVLKDLLCVPRPYSPPLARLSVGTHAQEYGFPSTHSTNSVSMALFFAQMLLRNSHESWYEGFNLAILALLVAMVLTVTFGRIYCGMHSMMDVAVGSIFGVLCWAAHYALEDIIDNFTVTSGYQVPLFVIPTLLFSVFVHPAPAEDCPCFEDAVAFVSVVAGIMLGRHFYTEDFMHTTLSTSAKGVFGQAFWVAACGAKLLIGVLAIFTWRLVAKEIAHLILPPLFRFFSPLLLPRRHYVDATEYDKYEPLDGLHPIPSILDLPTMDELEGKDGGHSQSTSTSSTPSTELRNRFPDSKPLESTEKKSYNEEKAQRKREELPQLRRDADVLTKVIVYSGIGWIATIAVPYGFEMWGLSVSLI